MTALIPDGLDATLVLLRHGESMAIVERRFQGQLDTPLSPIGLRQVELAAARLARPHVTPELPVPLGAPMEIVHSPLTRTTQTASAVADAAAADDSFGARPALRPDAGFLEIGQGEWEGHLASEIDERWRDILEAWWEHPTETHAPGGESLDVVSARVRASLPALFAPLASTAAPAAGRSPVISSHAGPSRNPWSIIVAHDGVLKVVLLTLFDLPLERFWLFPFALCGITIVDVRSGQPRLRAHNLTDHLAPLLEEQAQAVSEERERSGAL